MLKSKALKIKEFDFDNLLTEDNNIFGLPFTEKEAEIIIIPVPWDATVSYGSGTADAPEAVNKASLQLDLFDSEYTDAWHAGFYLEPLSVYWKNQNKKLRALSESYINHISQGFKAEEAPEQMAALKQLNRASVNLNLWLEKKAKEYLNKNKIVGVLGGEHSAPLGLINALSKKYNSFSILHIDAHADLRAGYEGFEYSHASIMHHALKNKSITKLVQIGVRDVGFQENECINSGKGRIITHFWSDIKAAQFKGKTWHEQCFEMLSGLTDNVYISLDIDGLEPSLCPHTGTPVPGGLSFHELSYLLKQLSLQKKRIIGFDLCEVAPGNDAWDANVGARVLYKLCALSAVSNNLI